jgi:hypothetical protein
LPYKIDWVRLTQKNERTLTVTWQGENLEGSSLALYYGVDKHGTEKRLIAEGIPAAEGTYVWDTTHLPQGMHYLYGHLTNGSGSGLWTYTSSLVSIGIDISRQTLKVFIPTVSR